MRKLIAPLILVAGLLGMAVAQNKKSETGPLKVLVVAGGCCHDYETQSQLLKVGIEERLNAEVTVVFNPDKGTDTRFEIYEKEDWADAYDLILHDECSAKVTEPAYVKRILDAHRAGKPAVNLHCAMHSYRWGDFKKKVELGADNAHWYEMIGLQSSGHGPKKPIDVTYTDKDHPITKGFENWTTIDEELYNNIQVFDSAHTLATGKQGDKEAVVVWTNEYGPKKTKIFSTSLGHFNETVADDRYLDLVVRGALWVTGNLKEDGTPVEALAK